jgi:hypothetical protein
MVSRQGQRAGLSMTSKPKLRAFRKPRTRHLHQIAGVEGAMPILNKLAQFAVKPFPRTITPKTHAVLDYINVGILLIGAAAFWRRNKRAAIGALAAAGAALAVDLLTDYPGGAKRLIKFHIHRDIDFGLAALAAGMPEFLAFDEDHERKLFLTQGALISAVNELTQFPDLRAGKRDRRRNSTG